MLQALRKFVQRLLHPGQKPCPIFPHWCGKADCLIPWDCPVQRRGRVDRPLGVRRPKPTIKPKGESHYIR